MKIIISSDPEKIYLSNNISGRFGNKRTLDFLRSVAGKTFDVDTTRLLPDEFVIKTNDSIYEKIEEKYIIDVINDLRYEYKRCGDCGRSIEMSVDMCPYCSCLDFINIIKKEIQYDK